VIPTPLTHHSDRLSQTMISGRAGGNSLPLSHLLAIRVIRKFYRRYHVRFVKQIDLANLYSLANIHRILHTDLCASVGRVYVAWPDNEREARLAREIERLGGIAPKTQVILDVLHGCSHDRIPKSLCGGVLELYCELVEGLRLSLPGKNR
jgi:hypothetical protein